MRDVIQNYQDFVVGMMVGDTFTDLTKYLTDFNLTLDVRFESAFLGGRETEWSVPVGAMTPADLVGYIVNSIDQVNWSDIFESETDVLFMIYASKEKRAFVLRGNVNTDAIDSTTGTLTRSIPIQVSGGDWTARLRDAEAYDGIDNGTILPKTYVFAYLTEQPAANLAIEEGANGAASAITDLMFTSATAAPSFYFKELTAGTARDVEVDGSTTDKEKLLWGIAQVRD